MLAAAVPTEPAHEAFNDLDSNDSELLEDIFGAPTIEKRRVLYRQQCLGELRRSQEEQWTADAATLAEQQGIARQITGNDSVTIIHKLVDRHGKDLQRADLEVISRPFKTREKKLDRLAKEGPSTEPYIAESSWFARGS